jgi:putative transposase
MPSLAYRYRIYPYGDQAKRLERWIDSCRKLYNIALEQRRAARIYGRKVGYPQQQRELTELRASFPEYAEVPVHVLQNVLLRLDRAYENAFRRCRERRAGKRVRLGFPRFKARDRYRSITCPDMYNYIRGTDLHFPKIGRIRMEMHRPLPAGAVVKGCTISKNADGWYASLSLQIHEAARPVHSGATVGLDVGLDCFAALSTGERIIAPKFLRNAERRLKRAQRVLARRKKGSGRHACQRNKVARMHAVVARTRADWQWKLATDFARRFSVIYVEDLRIANMLRNHSLAKSISDVSWGVFLRTRLDHAAVKAGSRAAPVDPRGTSRTCSRCGWVWESMTLGDREFRCEKCGLVLDRDVNAARNIHRVGRDTPEVTRGETRASAFRYRRRASSVAEPRTVPGKADVA